MENILIIGASGQIGTELTTQLREIYGNDHVIASDIRPPQKADASGPFETLDVMNQPQLQEILAKYKVTQVYLLAAMLSATAEKKPKLGWDLNMNSLFYLLDAAKEKVIKKLYWPSSIAVFGPSTPRENTPQYTVMDPNTIYGISKLAGERYCEYYHQKYGVDVRSLRYPGLIGHQSAPGGGTTDYAVHIFYEARKQGHYESFLGEHTTLPMLYMPDALKATINIMEAPAEQIKIRSSYNLAGMSFSPQEIAQAIQQHIPDFTISYKPDERQAIAQSWPESINDQEARDHWGWRPDYNLDAMVKDMLDHI